MKVTESKREYPQKNDWKDMDMMVGNMEMTIHSLLLFYQSNLRIEQVINPLH